MPLHEDIRELLREPIRRVGQSEVARRSGIAQPNVSAWLAGRRTMSIDNCEALADACGVRLTVALRAR